MGQIVASVRICHSGFCVDVFCSFVSQPASATGLPPAIHLSLRQLHLLLCASGRPDVCLQTSPGDMGWLVGSRMLDCGDAVDAEITRYGASTAKRFKHRRDDIIFCNAHLHRCRYTISRGWRSADCFRTSGTCCSAGSNGGHSPVEPWHGKKPIWPGIFPRVLPSYWQERPIRFQNRESRIAPSFLPILLHSPRGRNNTHQRRRLQCFEKFTACLQQSFSNTTERWTNLLVMG